MVASGVQGVAWDGQHTPVIRSSSSTTLTQMARRRLLAAFRAGLDHLHGDVDSR